MSQIKNPVAQQFYNTELGKVLLFDYHNQFGLDLENAQNPKLLHYLNYGTTIAYTGKKLKYDNQYSLDHHKEFILNTKQAAEQYQNSANRLKAIGNIFKEYKEFTETFSQKLNSFIDELEKITVHEDGTGECVDALCLHLQKTLLLILIVLLRQI